MAETADHRDDGDAATLGRALRAIVVRALDEAGRRASSTVEAEHLLLAIAADRTRPAARVLAESGLDYDAVQAALRAERTQSLAVAGVSAVDEAHLQSSARSSRPRWGTSLREALRRAEHRSGRDRRRRLAEADLLAGVLSADLGTVPRALALAGIDRGPILESLYRL